MEKNEITRSERLQNKVNELVGNYFDDIAKADTLASFAKSEAVKKAQTALEKAKLDAYYSDQECRFDSAHICAKIFGYWAQLHDCKFDNKSGLWTGNAVENIARYVFEDDKQTIPVKGEIRDNSPKNISRTFVDTTARAASWLAWIQDVYKTTQKQVKKARKGKVEKCLAYIREAHKYLKLSVSVKRAAKTFGVTEESLRQCVANEIQKERTVFAAKLNAKAKRTK